MLRKETAGAGSFAQAAKPLQGSLARVATYRAPEVNCEGLRRCAWDERNEHWTTHVEALLR